MDIKKYDRTTVRIYAIVVIAILLTDVILTDRNRDRTDIFSAALGIVTAFFFFMDSQRIVRYNNFRTYLFFGVAVFIAALTKQLMAGFYVVPLFLAGLPIIFILYFRGLLALFFKSYPDDKPTIVFASQYSGSAYYDGKDEGYKPTMKEKVFSLLIFIGFIFFVFGLLWLSKNVFKII